VAETAHRRVGLRIVWKLAHLLAAAGALMAISGCVAGGKASVAAPATQSAITSVSVSCSPTSILLTQTSTCSESVQGTGAFSPALTLAIQGGALDTVSGIFTPLSAGTATITATSVQDPTKRSSTTVTVVAAPVITSVAVTCTPSSVLLGQTSQCAATVQGIGASSAAVGWSATGGAITALGLFTSTSAGPATIRATSTQDGTKFGLATVNVTLPPSTITSISVVCAPASILTTQSSTCTPTVAGTGSYGTGVTWSVSPAGIGAVSAAGVFTPAVAGTATITATSTQDATKTGMATISLQNPAPLVFSVTPGTLNASASPGTVTVLGADFVSGSRVMIGGTPLATTYLSSTQLSATLPAAEQIGGNYAITVNNPTPGGGASPTSAFLTIIPVIVTLSPASGTVGSSLSVSVVGANTSTPGLDTVTFSQAGQTIGVAVTTATASSNGVVLNVAVPLGLSPSSATAILSAPSTVSATVGGMGAATGLPFEVTPPAHALSISPQSSEQGTTIPVSLTGVATSFSASTALTADDPGLTFTNISTLSSDLITASLSVGRGVTPGNHKITASGGSSIIPFSFSVLAASSAPITLSSLSSTSLPPLAPLTLHGTGFTAGSSASSSVVLNYSYSTASIQIPITNPADAEIDTLAPAFVDPNSGQFYTGPATVQVIVNGRASGALPFTVLPLPANTGAVGATTVAYLNRVGAQLTSMQYQLSGLNTLPASEQSAIQSLISSLQAQLNDEIAQVTAAAGGGTGTGPDGTAYGQTQVDIVDRFLQATQLATGKPISLLQLQQIADASRMARPDLTESGLKDAAGACKLLDGVNSANDLLGPASSLVCIAAIFPPLAPVFGPICGVLKTVQIAMMIINNLSLICDVMPINLSSVTTSPARFELPVTETTGAGVTVTGTFSGNPNAFTNGVTTLIDNALYVVGADKGVPNAIFGSLSGGWKTLTTNVFDLAQNFMDKVLSKAINVQINYVPEFNSLTSATVSLMGDPLNLVTTSGLTVTPNGSAGGTDLNLDLSSYRLLDSTGKLTPYSDWVSGDVVFVTVTTAVSVTPATTSVEEGDQVKFSATVLGSSNQDVNWLVDQIPGGNSTVGTISSSGDYTAPDSAGTHIIAAASVIDGSTASATVSVYTPTPSIRSLTPASVQAGAASQTLTINGTGFLASSTVTFNGVGRAATFVDINHLTIALTQGDLTTAGSYPVVVTNPAPGGGSSSAVNFTVTGSSAAPAITSFLPATLPAGSAAQTLTINGTGFLATPTVTFNGTSHLAIFVNSTQLTISLTLSDLATAGSYPVVVTNPAPGGVASPAVNFTVNSDNPVPTITSLSIFGFPEGASPQTLTIVGTGFLSSSMVTFNGVGHAVDSPTATQLTVMLTSADLATAGSYPLVVTNPPPGGGSSAAVDLPVVSVKSVGQWTWIGGSNDRGPNANAMYGTLGTPASGNHPALREPAASWTDKSGNLWLFGGYGDDSVSNGGDLNDLWEFNPSSRQWAWMSGSNTLPICGPWICRPPDVFGSLGVSAPENVPGGRSQTLTWTDGLGDLWLFGGSTFYSSYRSAFLNDLWKFDPTTRQWTWMSGSTTAPCNPNSECGEPVVWGTKGVAASSNNPGGRDGAVGWTDGVGNFWLFGGGVIDSTGNQAFYNDLWKFDPSVLQWTWMGGTNIEGQSGVFGAVGIPAAGNMPGNRSGAVSWTDKNGNFWLFGGQDRSYFSGSGGLLNDLWEFNPSTGLWAWMSGSNSPTCSVQDSQGNCTSPTTEPGVYGTLGVPAPGNVPGSRYSAVSWTDSNGHLWLHGGFSGNGVFDDLWEFNPIMSQWSWMGGASTPPCFTSTLYVYTSCPGLLGVYGVLGVPSHGNAPGSRSQAVSWTDNNGDLWLFGGHGFNSTQDSSLNDLWRYQP